VTGERNSSRKIGHIDGAARLEYCGGRSRVKSCTEQPRTDRPSNPPILVGSPSRVRPPALRVCPESTEGGKAKRAKDKGQNPRRATEARHVKGSRAVGRVRLGHHRNRSGRLPDSVHRTDTPRRRRRGHVGGDVQGIRPCEACPSGGRIAADPGDLVNYACRTGAAQFRVAAWLLISW
jgi:hypothetical protein